VRIAKQITEQAQANATTKSQTIKPPKIISYKLLKPLGTHDAQNFFLPFSDLFNDIDVITAS
jgi:hypothetical protein